MPEHVWSIWPRCFGAASQDCRVEYIYSPLRFLPKSIQSTRKRRRLLGALVSQSFSSLSSVLLAPWGRYVPLLSSGVLRLRLFRRPFRLYSPERWQAKVGHCSRHHVLPIPNLAVTGLAALRLQTVKPPGMVKWKPAVLLVSEYSWVLVKYTSANRAVKLPASNCRGSVEGAPSCANAAWSLWTGSFGNGFCCEVGLTGAFVNGGSVAGICVTSVPSGYSTASLVRKLNGIYKKRN